ncbi:MAG: transcription termination/antitermination NusG family protein [Bryobacteraceae bacterium]
MSNESPWYAIRTKSRFEKAIASALTAKGYECFLPLYKNTRTYSYREAFSHLPLFSGYVFSRVDMENRLPLLQTPGLVGIVSAGPVPLPVDVDELEVIRRILRSDLPASPWPFLQTGHRVRIDYGSLRGVEGILVDFKGRDRIVVSVSLLQRSVAVEIDRGWIEPLSPPAKPPGIQSHLGRAEHHPEVRTCLSTRIGTA